RIAAPRASASAKPAKKADGTQEIELGDVLEVMQKMPGTSQRAVPTVELAATPVETPAPKAQAAAPVNPNATVEIRPGDVLEEIVLSEVVAPVETQTQAQQVQTAPMMAPPSVPQPVSSQSDLAATQIRTPAGPARAPLAQFSVDDEVAPFASDTVDIPLDRIPGLPIWLQVKGKPGVAIVGGAIGACALIGALALGMHFHNSSSDTTGASSQATTTSNASMNMNHDDPSAAIPPPPAAPDVPSVSINDLQKDGKGAADSDSTMTSHAWAPAHHTSHASHHADASSAPATFVSHKHVTAKQPQGFGLIRTWIAARGEPISVDGKNVGVAPSPVRVACGQHTVAIGKEVVQANVPCDGAVTVGSPDHKKS
ncbi:MAG: hypothetical protein ABI183_13490, partial [Polyangiaceae bacterium]